METLLELLDTAVARHGDRQAVGMAEAAATQWWSFRDLGERTDRAAALLQGRGVGHGDRVGIWAPNGPAWVAAFFAILKAGGVVVPLDVNSRPDFVASVLETTRARLLIAGQPQRGQAPDTTPIVPVEELANAPAAPFTPVAVRSDDLAEVVFTSGTTGKPKGALLTHGNIVFDVEAAGTVLPSLPRYRVLSVLPLSHMFEQTCGLLVPLHGGSSLVYLPALQAANIFRAFEREGITCMLAVPQLLQLFIRGIEREVDRQGKRRPFELLLKVASLLPFTLRRRLFPAIHQRLGGHLEFFVSGGAHLDPALQRRWERLGIKVVQGYGATECAPIITCNTLDRRIEGSVGRPLPGVAIRIAPDGEVLVSGKNVTPGYWENPAATDEALKDGWYHTGDLGEMDAAGNLRLRGRKKLMIVLPNGMNVFPEDIEQVLAQDERLKDAVVLGVEVEGETQVHAVLLMKELGDPAGIVKQANRRLASHQAIRNWSVWPLDDFPRTHTLKVRRTEVNDAIREQRRETAKR